jgi:hypothetical protein
MPQEPVWVQQEESTTTDGGEDMQIVGDVSQPASQDQQGRRRFYRAVRKAKPHSTSADQLMEPEWLIDIPPDLAENWCAKREPGPSGL